MMSELIAISQVKSEWQELKQNYDAMLWAAFVQKYKADERSGIKAILESVYKAEAAYLKEEERIQSLRLFENKFGQDHALIGGIDEVGRGPLAGPVITCAVILPKDCHIHGINDSKKLSEKKREELYEILMKEAVSVSLGRRDAERIDKMNILQATYEAMGDSVRGLNPKPDLMLVDAVHIPNIDVEQVDIIQGDAKSISIGAASILAKVTRDHMMEEYDVLYPEYGFARNKGYGTAEHIEALKKYGPCPIHRASFIGNFF